MRRRGGGRGAAALVAARRGGGGGGGGGCRSRKDRLYSWSPPFGASDAKVLFEANSRMTSAEFSADGKTLFVNEGNDLYAVRLADPTKHYEIAKGATIAAGGRGGRGGGGRRRWPRRRGQRFGVLQQPGRAADQARSERPAGRRWSASDGKTVFLEGTKYFPDWAKTAPHNFVDKVDFETGQKTRAVRGQGRDRRGRRRAARRRLQQGHRVAAVADDGAGFVSARHEDGHGDEAHEERGLRAGSRRRRIRKRLLVERPRDGYKFYIDVTLPKDYREGTRLPGIIWFYPTEFSTQQEYDQRRRTTNINQFANVGARSPEIWVTQGYVVIQPVDIPIVGPTGRMNDHYVDELREDLDLTIDAVDKAGYLDRDRLGIGGHSYGAFST